MRYRQSDADVTSSNYKYNVSRSYYDSGGGNSANATGGYNTAYAALTSGDSINANTEGISGTITLYNPLQTVARKVYMSKGFWQRNGEDTMEQHRSAGLCDNANTVLSGITLYFSSGNITSGTVSVYGLKP